VRLKGSVEKLLTMPAQQAPITPLITDVQLAAYLGVSVATPRKWRLNGTGPRWFKLGGGSLVRYSLNDVQAWLEKCPAGGEALEA
jgi:predicted DNA-binding transcriptional regulator AlpA